MLATFVRFYIIPYFVVGFFLYILLATNVMITERQTLNDIHKNTVVLTRIPSVIREYRYVMG